MLKNNMPLKLLSFFIAVFLWFYVIGEVNPTVTQTVENVPVELLNVNTLEQRELAVQGGDNFSVDIVIEGRRGDLNRLDKDEIKASADIFGYEKGNNYVPVQVEVPENISLKKIKTPKIEITLEELVSVYKGISIKFKGKTKHGTEPGQVDISPAEVEIKGAKTEVDSVEAVQAEINASEITDDLRTFTAEPVAINRNSDPVYNVGLSAESVEVEMILYHTKTVPLKVDIQGKVPKEYELEDISVPDEITIKGTKAALEKISSVTAEPVDLGKVTASTTIELNPKLPEGVEIASGSQNRGVDVRIRGVSAKTLKLSTGNCIFNHLGKNLNANVNTGEISITFTGNEQLIEAAEAGDFTLSVDLKGLKEGMHAVEAKVTSNKKFNSIKIKPKTLEVTIKAEI